LLLGENPQDYLPHTYIIINIDGINTIIHGSITTMLEKVEDFCNLHCKDKQYPIEGLLEAVANAIIHRDYLDLSSGISIDIDERHVTVTNPGSLVPGNKLFKNMINENPKRRNPWLYQRALLMDEDKRIYKYGLGMEKISNLFAEYGEVKYVNLDSRNLFKAVLPTWIEKN
jgi:predicted HTH transcriptional regulator